VSLDRSRWLFLQLARAVIMCMCSTNTRVYLCYMTTLIFDRPK